MGPYAATCFPGPAPVPWRTRPAVIYLFGGFLTARDFIIPPAATIPADREAAERLEEPLVRFAKKLYCLD